MSTLTKAMIVERFFAEGLFSKSESARVIETLFELMKKSLETGEDVLVSGFGKWSVHRKHARTGRDPQSGKALRLSARKVVTFKCSHLLREKINAPAAPAKRPAGKK